MFGAEGKVSVSCFLGSRPWRDWVGVNRDSPAGGTRLSHPLGGTCLSGPLRNVGYRFRFGGHDKRAPPIWV